MGLRDGFRESRARLVVLVLILTALTAGTLAVRSKQAAPDPPARTLADAEAAAVAVPDSVTTVRPALRATLSEGVTDEILQQVRTVPGVAAAAGVVLSQLEIEAPSGNTQITVAGVDPDEFRPLAPDLTAQARFVWEGLHRSQTFIANEEYQILGGQPIQSIAAQGPGGRQVLQIGGVATNGAPSLAGAIMSRRQADQLGLGSPTMLIVGVSADAKAADVTKALNGVLPDVSFESMLPPSGRSFFAGTSAQQAIGSFSFTVNPDGSINQDRKWINEHLASERMPIIGTVRCHKVMLPQLRAALEEIENSGLAHLLKPEQAGRCFQPRFVERDPVNHSLSKHAWGLAIDLNVYDNPEGSVPKMDSRIVAIFEKWGFRWGGRWTKPDGMHFELAALLRG